MAHPDPRMTMSKLHSSLRISGLLLLITGCLVIILASTNLNSQLFVNILIALGTISAATFTALAARAARDSADQWREQKKYDLEVNSLLEALQAVRHWSDTLMAGRSIINPQSPNQLISFFVNQSPIRCARHEKKHDEINNAWINARAAINKAEHLGFYEESCVLDLCRFNKIFNEASSSTLYAMHHPNQNKSHYNSEKVAIAFQTNQDTFETKYLHSITNFIQRYKDYYKEITNIGSG